VTHVAGSPSSLGVDADDAVADDAVDGVALLVGHDGGGDEVQELNGRSSVTEKLGFSSRLCENLAYYSRLLTGSPERNKAKRERLLCLIIWFSSVLIFTL